MNKKLTSSEKKQIKEILESLNPEMPYEDAKKIFNKQPFKKFIRMLKTMPVKKKNGVYDTHNHFKNSVSELLG